MLKEYDDDMKEEIDYLKIHKSIKTFNTLVNTKKQNNNAFIKVYDRKKSKFINEQEAS